MKLQVIFDALASGEFSQLHIGGQEQGVINESNWKNVLTHVNLGLTALHTRFPLRKGKLVLGLQTGTYLYQLTEDFALANVRSKQVQSARYILDTTALPYKGDLMLVEKVSTPELTELALNDAANPYSCFTPKGRLLVVNEDLVDQVSGLPDCLKTDRLVVEYRANHPAITVPIGYFDPVRVEVELPDTHLEALLYFVASRVNNPIGMNNEFHAGNNYAAKYEQACQQLLLAGVQPSEKKQVDRISRGGWV